MIHDELVRISREFEEENRTHHFVLGNVEDLLLDDLGLVLRQEVQYGLGVGCGLDEWVLK